MEHKARSIISAALVFLGLLLPLRFPSIFWPVVLGCSLGSALAVFWIFGERPSWKRVREDWFTIVFVFLTVATGAIFAYLIPHPVFQALFLGLTITSLYFVYQVGSRLKRGYTPSLFLRNVISLVTIMEVLLVTSNALKWSNLSSAWYVQPLVLVMAFVFTFIISEFLYETQGVLDSIAYSLALALGVMQIIFVSSYWLVSYPESIRITNIGVPLPSIISALFFYLFWGISHHRLEGTLTKRVVWEYILISLSFLSVLLFTTSWTAI